MKKLLLLLFSLIVLPVGAQQTGNIVGTVLDPSGASIVGADVTLTNAETHFQRDVMTNERGEYVASSLPIGAYKITTQKQGFAKFERSGVTLSTAATLTVDLVLTVGSESETVQVTAQASLLQAQTGEVSNLVDSKQIVSLPLPTRNFTDLVLLSPGAHEGSAGNLAEGASPYSIRGGANFSVNGSLAAGNSYLIDGLYNRNQWLNTLVMVPIIDSIEEYRVMTSNFTAEYGEAAGAVTTVTTKSGTNNFHGSVWEFLRNDIMNANYYFSKNSANPTPRARYHRNVFGGTFGGAILKDRLFFFGDYQGIRQSTPTQVNITLPTQAQVNMVKTGDFSALGTQLYNPFTGTATQRQPFRGNNLSAYLDPAAVKFISLLPTPTQPGSTNNYRITPTNRLTDDQFDVRLDENIGQSDRLFVKYSFDKPVQTAPGTVYPASNAPISVGPFLASGGDAYATQVQTQSGTLGFNHVFSSTLLLEAHADVLRWYGDIVPLGQSFASATAIGISGINYNAESGGLPGINITNFANLGDGSTYPNYSRITTFQYDGDIIKTLGNHTIKGGALFLRHRFNAFSSSPIRGTFTFNGQFTSQIGASNTANAALADFAIGAESAANRGVVLGEAGMRVFQLGAYLQDSWRVTDRFTVEYGGRYDISAPPYEVHDHWANVDLQTGLLRVAGLNGNGRRLRNIDYNTFQPHLGFALTLDGSRRSVLRGGASISYVDTLIGGQQLYKNLPFFFAQTIATTSTAAPPTTLSAGFPTPVAPNPNDTAAISSGSPIAWDVNTKQSRSIQYNLGVQRMLPWHMLADLAYVGTRGEHLLFNGLNLNQAAPGAGSVNSRRPYNTLNPNLVNLSYQGSGGDSFYNSLQARLERRVSAGINFGASYTYASSLADVGEPNSGGNGNFQDSRCIRCNYGPMPNDFRHTLVVNSVFELPFGHGRRFVNSGALSQIVGPWNLSTIWRAHTGDRFTVYYGTNVSNSSGGGTQRPNRIASGILKSGKSINNWFDKSAFVAPAQYTFGNSGTGILTGPNSFIVDLTLERHFVISHGLDANLRGEAFNAFNHANFNDPNATIGNANAGIISSTGDPRVLQVALKLSF